MPLLEIRNLKTEFHKADEVVRAVDGVDLTIGARETVGVIGESGSGKSVLALSIMNLVPRPPGRITAGEILYEGRDLLTLPARQMRALRGKTISMIFQQPTTSLNPVATCGEQIAEALMLHGRISRDEAMEQAADMLKLVRIAEPGRRLREYPHQLSGGMCQRVMIAIAIACNPRLLIADEPTTALDVTVQAQILELLDDLKSRLGMSMLLITHDMGVVAETSQRVVVMYGARVVEEADVLALFDEPLHPYTRGLMRAIPRVDSAGGERRRLQTIPGSVQTITGDVAPGCRFAARCPQAMPVCAERDPLLSEPRPGHKVACWLYP
ncbi:MAG TPA: ABC transporter ATP-binding protein [Burkholderiaceae bacterium]|nr:ABC transporter ATP-binding protein [Burkholderiaceae bacterium]